MQPPVGGGGDLTPPPGVSEQAEADMVSPSISTVFVAGGSGFVGSEICKQVGDRKVFAFLRFPRRGAWIVSFAIGIMT